jgi:hypothetical protein
VHVTIKGLEQASTDVLVRIQHLDGSSEITRLNVGSTFYQVKGEAEFWTVLKTYMVFGIEHILAGMDHLLFVACLMFIAGSWRRILVTITGFTIAHSITLKPRDKLAVQVHTLRSEHPKNKLSRRGAKSGSDTQVSVPITLAEQNPGLVQGGLQRCTRPKPYFLASPKRANWMKSRCTRYASEEAVQYSDPDQRRKAVVLGWGGSDFHPSQTIYSVGEYQIGDVYARSWWTNSIPSGSFAPSRTLSYNTQRGVGISSTRT